MMFSPLNAVHAQAASTSVSTVTEQVQPLYDVYGSNVYQIIVVVNGSSSSLSPNHSFTVESGPKLNLAPNSSATESENILPNGLYNTSITVFTSAASFQVNLQGFEIGQSFLWRYIVSVPYVQVLGVTTTDYVTVPSGTVLSQVYTSKGATLSLTDVTAVTSGNGLVTYRIFGPVGLLVLQSRSFLPTSIAITVVALAVVALAAFNFLAIGKRLFDDLSRSLRTAVGKLANAFPFLGKRKGFRLRRLFQPRKLLALFILCALVMVALGALGGPDPRVKAYMITGSSTATDLIQTELQKVPGAGNLLVLTPTQDFTDFDVMSSVGQFNIVVFSNYTNAEIQEVSPYILGNLGNVPIIIIGGTGNATISRAIATLYPNQILNVSNAASLTSSQKNELATMLSQSVRTNVLGLNLSNGEFQVLLESEAALSMLLVFIGWMFLGSLISDSRSKTNLSHLAMVVAAGIFVFFFSEAIYVVTSSTLAVPLSLHAVNSDAHDVTAIGLLGFGGGSTPRLAAGFLGVIAGAVGVEGGLRVKKSDFALVTGAALILLANPLSIGQYVYQAILLFFPLGSLVFGNAFSNSITLKGFIYGFGSLFGGDVSQVYLLSAGKILFFAGLIPLAYLKRMGRTTMVIALLLVALAIGDGGVRVGEMTPDKTVVAVVPGLVVGFAFAAVILGLAALEKYVRGNWKARA
jgi:hypothetical protein